MGPAFATSGDRAPRGPCNRDPASEHPSVRRRARRRTRHRCAHLPGDSSSNGDATAPTVTQLPATAASATGGHGPPGRPATSPPGPVNRATTSTLPLRRTHPPTPSSAATATAERGDPWLRLALVAAAGPDAGGGASTGAPPPRVVRRADPTPVLSPLGGAAGWCRSSSTGRCPRSVGMTGRSPHPRRGTCQCLR